MLCRAPHAGEAEVITTLLPMLAFFSPSLSSPSSLPLLPSFPPPSHLHMFSSISSQYFLFHFIPSISPPHFLSLLSCPPLSHSIPCILSISSPPSHHFISSPLSPLISLFSSPAHLSLFCWFGVRVWW